MFAAASGARLAHRHNKAVKKQISTSQIEDLQVHYKAFQKQQHFKYSDNHGNRFLGIPQRRHNQSAKLYSSNCDSVSSYIDINGRISKFGHVDFEAALLLREKQELRKKKLKIRRRRYELPAHVATREIAPFPQFPPNSWGKAAWQDRELLNHELERRESVCVSSEAAVTHRTKQREAHRRWVKRNRIQDLTLGECSSEEEFLYGVQNGAANLLLYVGLGTMCIGMIIAFVGTGEKGFKTMELRLIGPSLIGAGILLIILRVMLCVCPSKCLKLKKSKQKLKNTTNKLNSEGSQASQELSTSKEHPSEELLTKKTSASGKADDDKKRVSIVMLPTTSGFSTNLPTSSVNVSTLGTPTYSETTNTSSVPTISFVEQKKPNSSKSTNKIIPITSDEESAEEKAALELKQLDGNSTSASAFGSQSFGRKKFPDLPETFVSAESSESLMPSLFDSTESELTEVKKGAKTNASKFAATRNPKNLIPNELVLCPSSLNETKDTD